jgi:hypothetical protein
MIVDPHLQKIVTKDLRAMAQVSASDDPDRPAVATASSTIPSSRPGNTNRWKGAMAYQ